MMTRTVLIFLLISSRLLTKNYLIEVENKRGDEGVEKEDEGEDEEADGEGREARLSRENTVELLSVTIFKPPIIPASKEPIKGNGKICRYRKQWELTYVSSLLAQTYLYNFCKFQNIRKNIWKKYSNSNLI